MQDVCIELITNIPLNVQDVGVDPTYTSERVRDWCRSYEIQMNVQDDTSGDLLTNIQLNFQDVGVDLTIYS